MSPKRILNYLLCPSVQNFFIDFRKYEPVSYFRLNSYCIEGAYLANFSPIRGGKPWKGNSWHSPRCSGLVAGFCDLTTASLEVNLLRELAVLLSENVLSAERSVKIFSLDWILSESSLSTDWLFVKLGLSFASIAFFLSLACADEWRNSTFSTSL